MVSRSHSSSPRLITKKQEDYECDLSKEDAMKGAGTLVFLFLLFFSSFLRDLSWLGGESHSETTKEEENWLSP